MPSHLLPTIDQHGKIDTKLLKRSKGMLSTRSADACLDWVVFPALLFIQFAATMYCQMQQGVSDLDWKVVHAVVLLFCLVAGLYRQVLRRHPFESLVLLLLPEIFTNVLLAMVMFWSLEAAYEALISLTIILSLVGTAASVHIRLLDRETVPEDYQLLRSEEEKIAGDEWVC